MLPFAVNDVALCTVDPFRIVFAILRKPRSQGRALAASAHGSYIAAMITGIAHLCLIAKDLSAAESFYCGVLGMKKRFDFVRSGQIIGFYLNAGGRTFIEIFRSDSVPDQAGAIRHICLETDDIDGMIAQVKSRGHAIGEKKLGADESWQVWIKAPDGVDIEFHQYTPESHQMTGKACVLK